MIRWLLVACASCSGDIRLGVSLDAAPDAARDAAPVGPFTAGPYAMSLLGSPQITCMDALLGSESDFDGVTLASANLVGGSVQLAATTDELTVSGAPITTAFDQSSVVLVPDTGTMWGIAISGMFGSGPDATAGIGTSLALESATASAPSGIQGEVSRVYENASHTGQCSVTFGALLVSN